SLAELAVAGIAPGSSAERDLVLATFNPGTCMMGGAPCAENGDCGANGPCVGTSYTPFVDTAIDTAAHAARAAGVTHFSTFAVLPATLFSTLVRGGARRNVVRFMPPLAGSQCSPLVAFRVPTRGRGMRVVQGRARGASGRGDADTLRLRCLPQ